MSTLRNPQSNLQPFAYVLAALFLAFVVAIVASTVLDTKLDPSRATSAVGVNALDDRTALRHELETARHQLQMNLLAMDRLSTDRRWEMPEQQEHLMRAMQETEAIVYERRQRIDELERMLGAR